MAGRDRVEKFVLVSNSPDGEGAVHVELTPVPFVCRNTATRALIRDP